MRIRRGRARLLQLIVAVLALALFATACGGGSDDAATDSTTVDADTETVNTTNDDDDGGSGDVDEEPAEAEEPEVAEEAIVEEPEELAIEEEAADEIARGGTLRYGLEADVDGLDPTASALSAPGLMMGNTVFDLLTAYDVDGNAVPYLAESLTPNDDFTQWTVKLREGINFHDGTPLNSEAVQVNFEAQRASALVGLAVRPYYADPATEIIDDLSVQFNLIGPDAWWPASFAGQLGMIASPTWLAAVADDPALAQAPVGTGPFKFDSRSQDSVTRFVRNDDWWGGEVYLDAVEFVPVTDSDVRADLLLEGELEAIHTTVNDVIVDLRDTDYINNVLDDTGDEFFIMINAQNAPFDDIRARQALTFAAAKQNYLDLVGGGIVRPAEQMFTQESEFYNPDVVQAANDPDAATPLVAEYCAEFADNCTDGRINMEFQWSGPSVVQTRIAEIFKEGWKDHFNVEFQELLQDQHIQETAFGLYQVNTWRQFGAPDPSRDGVWIECATIGGISLNWARVCDEDRDALVNAARLSTDPAERIEILQDLSQNINEAYTYIFLNHTIWDNAFDESVNGVCGRLSPEGIELRCTVNGRTWQDSIWIDS